MKEVLIIGNKPYVHLPLDSIIDKFEENYRCNLGLPNRNNGTKYDKLGLCNHLYENLIQRKLNYDDFFKIYGEEYNEEYIRYYLNSFDENKSKYKEIFHAQFRTNVYNDVLNQLGCPHRFNIVPRTGYTLIFENLLKRRERDQQNKVFVFGFSLTSDKNRISYYIKPEYSINEGKGCHSKCDETKILAWLHNNKLIDATLCMLEDKSEPTLDCSDISPTPFVLNLLTKNYGGYVLNPNEKDKEEQ